MEAAVDPSTQASALAFIVSSNLTLIMGCIHVFMHQDLMWHFSIFQNPWPLLMNVKKKNPSYSFSDFTLLPFYPCTTPIWALPSGEKSLTWEACHYPRQNFLLGQRSLGPPVACKGDRGMIPQARWVSSIPLLISWWSLILILPTNSPSNIHSSRSPFLILAFVVGRIP